MRSPRQRTVVAVVFFVQTVTLTGPLWTPLALGGENPGFASRRGCRVLPQRLVFEPNRGQVDREVAYLARCQGYDLFLTPREVVLDLRGSSAATRPAVALDRASGNAPDVAGSSQPEALRLVFVDANSSPAIHGAGLRPSRSNYFIGPDPERWIRRVPQYSRVRYRELYRGVDLEFYSRDGQLEYDLTLAPGADPRRIALRVEGADSLELDASGDLLIHVGGGTVRQSAPVVYQEREGRRFQLASRYRVEANGVLRFEVEGHDLGLALIIDPTLVYSTFLGTVVDEYAEAIAVDSSGSTYVTGSTGSLSFPLRDAYQESRPGAVRDPYAFVTKLNPSGSDLVYSTYFGGGGFCYGFGIGVDALGRAVVAGQMQGAGLPTVNAPQSDPGGGFSDSFLAMFNAAGDDLVYSTYLGGNDFEVINDVAVDLAGNAYVVGNTGSFNFPVANAFQPTLRGGYSAFVGKISPLADSWVYLTYLGGDDTDQGLAIATDGSGHAYVTGDTNSEDFPIRNAYQGALNGDAPDPFLHWDIFVSKFSPDGSELVYSTYLGGDGRDQAVGIAADAAGHAYLTGRVGAGIFPDDPLSNGFPLKNPLFPDAKPPIFVSKILPSGEDLVFSTFLVEGDPVSGQGAAIDVDADGNIYVGGGTTATNFPVQDAIQGEINTGGQGPDGFLAKLSGDGSELLFSTYLGADGPDSIADVAAGDVGQAYVTGRTSAAFGGPDFPTTPGAYNETINGEDEAFIAAIDTVGGPSGPPFLEFGDHRTVTLTVAEPEQRFRLATPPGLAVTITATDGDAADANAVYMRWDAEATPALHDLAAAQRGQASQKAILPYTRNGILNLLVEAQRLNGGTNTVILLAAVTPVAIESLSIPRFTSGGVIHVAVRGAGLNLDTVFSVAPEIGLSINASDKVFVSPEQMDLEFDLAAAPAGAARLLAVNPITTDSAELAVEIVAPTTAPSATPPPLRLDIRAPDSVRSRRPARLTLDYENIGPREIDAPLLRIIGPPGSRLRLESEREFHDEVLEVLAVHYKGVAGKLPPAARSRISVIFELENDGEAPFRIYQFAPRPGDYVGWDVLASPTGVDSETWAALRAPLSVGMGASWVEFAASNASQATRRARRGKDAASARGAFLLAAQVATANPRRAAAVGIVRRRGNGEPVARTGLVALKSGEVAARTVTEGEGFFLLECLEPGQRYDLRLESLDLEGTAITLPADGSDLLGLRLFATDTPNALEPTAITCDPSVELGIETAPENPAELMILVGGHDARAASSHDPNEKDGPEGDGPGGLVGVGAPLHYTVHFENRPEATAPAQIVTVEDQLDRDLDWNTFRILEVGVGDRLFSLDTVRRSGFFFSTPGFSASATVDGIVPESVYSGVRARCDFDLVTGLALWTFETVDPVTGDVPPAASLEGFLPPNNEANAPRGTAHVSFSVRPRSGLDEGTDLRNEATITFDAERSLTTNQTVNTISYFLTPGSVPEPFFPSPTAVRGTPIDATLLWGKVSQGEGYDLYVWTGVESPRPADPLLAATDLATTFYSIDEPLDPATQFYWQIVVRGGSGEPIEGPVWSFTTVDPPPPPPAVPVAVDPSPGATEVPLRPTLRWNVAAAAQAYTVHLWPSAEPRPEHALISGIVSQQYALPFDLEPSADYSWQVVALNQSGETSGEVLSFQTGTETPVLFRRGDVDGDGDMDIADPLAGLFHLFVSRPSVDCEKALDYDDSNSANTLDVLLLLRYLFLDGAEQPAAPFPGCGEDPTSDLLECPETSSSCRA